jgi:hypothetical protein
MALSRRARRTFGCVHLATSATVALGVFAGLPVRYFPVDLGGALVAAAFLVSGAGLVLKARWREAVARVVSWVVLVVGLGLTTALALSASHVVGLYGPIGRGGALLLVMVALLVVPYLVVGPALSVHWLSRKGR